MVDHFSSVASLIYETLRDLWDIPVPTTQPHHLAFPPPHKLVAPLSPDLSVNR